ncbi:GNAT family N-acetyltransferase [Novosphingobium gossypii]|uniref:GNAT family N-acetyltransferase n=1 Tax=Novosphingobium gossypii TaxID=1604774 RepID=UPI003D1DD137
MREYAEALWGSWKPSSTIETFDLTNHQVVECDGVRIGCVAVNWQPDHLFIAKLYIDTPFQRQGFGAAVLEMKLKEANARGLPIKLSVLTTNPADAFYRREGFIVETETAERRQMSKRAPAVSDGVRAICNG